MSEIILKHFKISNNQMIILAIQNHIVNIYNQELFESVHVLSCSLYSSLLDELFKDNKYEEVFKYITKLREGD